MTPAERAARVDECERLVPAVCEFCFAGYDIEQDDEGDWWHIEDEDTRFICNAFAIHERLAALKGEDR